MNADEAGISEAFFLGKIETVNDWLEMLYKYVTVTDKKVLAVSKKYLTVASKKIKLTSNIRTLLNLEQVEEDDENEELLNTSNQDEETAKTNDKRSQKK